MILDKKLMCFFAESYWLNRVWFYIFFSCTSVKQQNGSSCLQGFGRFLLKFLVYILARHSLYIALRISWRTMAIHGGTNAQRNLLFFNATLIDIFRTIKQNLKSLKTKDLPRFELRTLGLASENAIAGPTVQRFGRDFITNPDLSWDFRQN